jgi:hypothetical protein
MSIIESEIKLNFPDSNYFRLCDCEGYKAIQNNFAEMDVCWYDKHNDTLYIIELKNWNNNTLAEESDTAYTSEQIQQMKKQISKYRIDNLLKKSVDTTCIFMSILLERGSGATIQRCSPFIISKKTDIKLLCIINWTDTDTTYIATINTQYKSKFTSYAKLFDIKAFMVLTKEQASKKFDWVQ